MKIQVSVALLAALWGVGSVVAEEARVFSYADFQAESQETTGPQIELTSYQEAAAGRTHNHSYRSSCCRSSGIVAGGEVTFLKPYRSVGMTDRAGNAVGFDLEAAPRWESVLDTGTTITPPL